MKIFLNILKELGIWLMIFVIVIATAVLVFKDQLPYDEVIREGEEYASADLKQYSVSSSDRISEVTAVTVTHEADHGQIVEAENEVRIQTGKYTPFGSISNTSDLPTEKVGGTSAFEGDNTNVSDTNTNKENTTTSNKTDKNEETLDYPEEDLVQDIVEDESESAESAANRRFDNVD